MIRFLCCLSLALSLVGCGGTSSTPRRTLHYPTPPVTPNVAKVPEPTPQATVEEPAQVPAPEPKEVDPLFDPVSERGQLASGLYVIGPQARKLKLKGIIKLVKDANLDAVVLDLKDGLGRVGHDTAIPELAPQKKGYLGDAAALVAGLKAAGIYTIGRVVCFSDPHLPARAHDRAIMHKRRHEPWTSWGTGHYWLDPFNRDNHEMIVKLAKEAVALGFEEVQLDYVRFPVDDGTKYARFPARVNNEAKRDALVALLKRVDESIPVPLGVDIFGLAAFRKGDPSGLGQHVESWQKYVEVFSPMLYINAMRDWQLKDKNRVRNLVQSGVARLRERIGPAPVIRPFLQAFGKGAGPTGYNSRFVAQEMTGAVNGGGDGILFWNPRANYKMLTRGLLGAARNIRLTSIPTIRKEARTVANVITLEEAERVHEQVSDSASADSGSLSPIAFASEESLHADQNADQPQEP